MQTPQAPHPIQTIVTEMTRHDATRFDSFDSYSVNAILRSHHYKEIGSGSFGAVFHKTRRDKTVIKVGRSLSDGWLKYAMWLRENRMSEQSTAFPKIYSLIVGDRFYVAEMERLVPLMGFRKTRAISESWKRSDWERFARPNADENPLLELPRHADEWMVSALIKLRQFFRETKNVSEDIHSGNVMRRPFTNQLVLSDPAA